MDSKLQDIIDDLASRESKYPKVFNAAYLPVPHRLLHRMLKLPDNWTIKGICVDPLRQAIGVTVFGDDLPEARETEMLPVIQVKYDDDLVVTDWRVIE